MQKAPVIKGSGLKPLDKISNEEVHVFGSNLEERIVESTSIKFEDPQNHEDDIETIRNRKFETLTGEEDEETVFHGEFKLYVWDLSTSNWTEKGRGQLKLNESFDQTKSRIIMRVSGTLRIILNVAIKSTFRVIASSKTNIRFTDGQNVWAASGSNANQLKYLIEERIEKTTRKEEEEKEEKKKRTHHDGVDSDPEDDVHDNNDEDSVKLKRKKCDDEDHENENDEAHEKTRDENREDGRESDEERGEEDEGDHARGNEREGVEDSMSEEESPEDRGKEESGEEGGKEKRDDALSNTLNSK